MFTGHDSFGLGLHQVSPPRVRRPLVVMPANQTNELVHYWAGAYGNVAHLYTPARAERARPWLPYAIDNGRYADVLAGREFDADRFFGFVDRMIATGQEPLWVAVPDVPFDATETMKWYEEFAPEVARREVVLAVVVQDGMTPDDVERLVPLPGVVFVGGSTEWKWDTVATWAKAWPRVHVGRVNSAARLRQLAALEIESCDGSGWFRGKGPQVVGLGRFLAEQSGRDPGFAERCAWSTRYIARDQLALRLKVVTV